MNKRTTTFNLLMVIGIASIVLYACALGLNDLRTFTIGFEWLFFAAFGLYALACWQVLQDPTPASRRLILLIFAFAVIFRALLVFSQPTLTDDMYRYIWDGRVQAHQINPYLYPPNAPEVAYLRDTAIWPSINRKPVVTVYPAGAELAFAAFWKVWPDNIHWFQAMMVLGDLIAAGLLLILLRAMGRSPAAVLIYLWNPLVIFELAHAAHVDGLVLPFLVAAWLARFKGRDALTGLWLGMAASLKLYPVLLLPVLWRPRDERGRWRSAWVMPLAFLAGFAAPYLPYISIGQSVLGFLPAYFNEQFNFLLTAPLFFGTLALGGRPDQLVNGFIAITLLLIFLFFFLHPAKSSEIALRRCIWPMGAYLLLTSNLWPWYVLWVIPLLAIFLPERRPAESRTALGWRILRTSWTGWWLFSGLVGLAYTFYIDWVANFTAIFAEFIPLYEFLLLDLARRLKNNRPPIRFL